jgi:hypothetical protein
MTIPMGQKPEAVLHPNHYGGDVPYEVIKVLRAWLSKEEFEAFLVATGITYLARYKKKNGLEDIQKALFYIRYLEGVIMDLEKPLVREPASGDLLRKGDGALSPRLISDGEPPNPIAWPDPTQEMLDSPLFMAVWNCIKKWDINVPNAYAGYCGATGNHVRAILDALNTYSHLIFYSYYKTKLPP